MPSFLRTSVSPSPNLECSLNKTFYDATWALKWHYHSHFIEGETKALRTEARLRIRSKVSNLHSSDLSHLPDWGNTKRPGIQLVTQPDAEKKKKYSFFPTSWGYIEMSLVCTSFQNILSACQPQCRDNSQSLWKPWHFWWTLWADGSWWNPLARNNPNHMFQMQTTGLWVFA